MIGIGRYGNCYGKRGDRPMIKTYFYNHSEQRMEHDVNLEELDRLLQSPDDLLWIDLYDVGGDELQYVAKLFNFHPLAIEDCLHISPRAKVDRYDNYYFFVVHALRYNEDSDDEITTMELNIFLGLNYWVTIHSHQLKTIGRLASICLKSTEYMNKGADYLLYSIVDGITDEYFPVMDRLSIRVDELEDEMFDQELEEIIDEFLALKRTLILIRRVILPQRRIFSYTNGQFMFPVQEENLPYFIDLADHLERLTDSTETFRDLVNGALETYSSFTSAKTNEIMRILTIISTIVLPLSFVTGVFGMNVVIPYAETRWALWAILAMMLVMTGGMLLWFKRRGWL